MLLFNSNHKSLKVQSTHISLCIRSLILLILIAPAYLNAATYYVDSSATNDTGNGSQSSPKKYVSSGISLMSSSGGDTLILMPGTYSDTNDNIYWVVNGKPGAYNIIKAQTDGTVTLNTSLSLTTTGPNQAQYVQFEGLKWRTTDTKAIIGHHIKVLRCAFEGGPADGNTVNFAVGTNDQSPGASDILIEDSTFYGRGGRYEVLIFNAENIVLRRVVVRHDLGWCFNQTFDGNGNCIYISGPPEAGLSVYSSRNIQVQNFMILDSDQNYQYWETAFYVVNNASNFDNDNTVIDGSLSINNYGVSYKFDGNRPITNSVIRNSVSYGGDFAALAFTGPNDSNSIIENMTLIGNSGSGILVGAGATTNDVSNTVIVGNNNKAIQNNSGPNSVWTHSNNNCSNNGNNNCFGTNETSYNAYTNGLLYPTRIESGSNLDSDGDSGGTVGANITLKLGISGTLYGENGYDTETSESLWPWPHEDRIKNDMCDEVGTGVPDRGWCATNLTLTEYIWSLIGNDTPIALSPMPTPQNFSSIKN